MQEKENILEIFEETKEAIEKENISRLKELSNQTIHTASITQDPDNIAVAVIVYALSKIIERGYHKHPKWDNEVILAIDKIIITLHKDDEEGFKQNLAFIRSSINKLSGNLKSYIREVFRKASINKASKVYEHGISLEKTAKLLGITMFELADYAGQKVTDIPFSKTMDTQSRIKLARGMFE